MNLAFFPFCFKSKAGGHTVFLLEAGQVGSNPLNINYLSLLGKTMQVVLLFQMLTRWLGTLLGKLLGCALLLFANEHSGWLGSWEHENNHNLALGKSSDKHWEYPNNKYACLPENYVLD